MSDDGQQRDPITIGDLRALLAKYEIPDDTALFVEVDDTPQHEAPSTYGVSSVELEIFSGGSANVVIHVAD